MLVPARFFTTKKTGKPIITAIPKNINCRLVKLKAIFVLTFDKSLGTGTYAMINTSCFNLLI